jgi:cation transport ATPase
MKINKLDFILYIKNTNLNWILYLIASLIVLIPIFIVLITDVPFSSSFSQISTSMAFVFVIAGKLITAFKKKLKDENISVDISIIIGILIAFISKVIK